MQTSLFKGAVYTLLAMIGILVIELPKTPDNADTKTWIVLALVTVYQGLLALKAYTSNPNALNEEKPEK